MTRYRKDRSWRAPGDGRVVIAGSPLRLFRVSAGGAHVLDAAETGEQPPTELVTRMLDRFVDAGALHPLPDAGPFTVDDVTVVIPAYGANPHPPAGVRVIVVDDASPSPLVVPAPAAVVRLPVNRGPAGARNAGLAEVATPLVAFVDADVVLTDGWLDGLLPHFADPRVALVAPRVRGSDGEGALAAYERRNSPLDLGDEPARISASTRVSYVPAAAIVCRVDALRAAGGFAEDMRVGEDVDLVWRLTDAGHRCRYESTVVVQHQPRSHLAALLRQRLGYGRSAGPLARRHPGALAPVRMSGWSAGVWALVVLRRPFLAAALAGGTTVALRRKLADLPPAEVARLTLLGHLGAGGQLAAAVTRAWWPAALAMGLVSRRARHAIVAALVVPPLVHALRARTAAPLVDAPLRWLDEGAYCAGVWLGAWDERTAEPLRPSFSAWPPRDGR